MLSIGGEGVYDCRTEAWVHSEVVHKSANPPQFHRYKIHLVQRMVLTGADQSNWQASRLSSRLGERRPRRRRLLCNKISRVRDASRARVQ